MQNKTSDLVVKNARQLLTCRDDAKDLIGLVEGGWVAVTDGKITKVGGKSEIEPLIGPGTKVVDATGKVAGVQEYVWPEADICLIEASNTRTFNASRDYYYPIPTFEIAQSDGNITQNPVW